MSVIVTDRTTGKSRGFAIVEMRSIAGAEAAIKQLNGKESDGKRLQVNKFQERTDVNPNPTNFGGGSAGVKKEQVLDEKAVPDKPAPPPKEEVEPETIRIFVGNLSMDTTGDSLRELFEQFGEVKSVAIETDEDGNSKGTASVEMSAAKAEEAVSTLNGKELDGKKIVVKKSE